MDKKLDFERLEIHRFPGFRPSEGFSLKDFAPGVNVIYGPNGSGKTTIAKAFQQLLWPKGSPGGCHVNGTFYLEDDKWYVEKETGTLNYVKNGVKTDLPADIFPPYNHRGRYYLALHELLQKNTRNSDFAEIIARESAGGYDISALADELDFLSRPSNAGRSTDKKAQHKLKIVKDIENRLTELQDEGRTLDKLKKELQVAKRAEQRANYFEKLIDYRERRKALEKLESRLDSFPNPVKKMEGDEKERLQELSDEIARSRHNKEENKETIEQARSVLEDVDFPEDEVSPGLLTNLEGKTDRLESLERNLEEVNQEIIKHRKVKEKILSVLAEEYNSEELSELSITSMNDLAEFSREAEEVRTGLEVHRRLSSWLYDEEERKNNLENLREGRRYLEDWLGVN